MTWPSVNQSWHSWEQVSDTQIAIEQNKQNGDGANHQPAEYSHVHACIEPLPTPLTIVSIKTNDF